MKTIWRWLKNFAKTTGSPEPDMDVLMARKHWGGRDASGS